MTTAATSTVSGGGGTVSAQYYINTFALGSDPFTADGTTTVVVAATSHGAITNDFVTFSGATGTYASTFNAQFQITYLTANTFTITVPSALTAGSYGGSGVLAQYQVNTGPATQAPVVGWVLS